MRIYIVDDDQLSIFLTKNMLALEDLTHDVCTFLSGKEALEALNAADVNSIPDILFLDLNMPMMDGWEFLNALAPLTQVVCKKCSIYVLTSSLDISDINRLKDYPFVSGLLHKPIRSEDINRVTTLGGAY